MAEHNQQVQSSTGSPPTMITKRDRAKFLTQEVKQGVRELLHHDREQQGTGQDEIFEDAAFDPQRVLQSEPSPKASFRHRLSISAKTVAGVIKNPKAVSRNTYTRHAAAKIANHPHDQSSKFDDELLDAHDALTSATNAPAAPSHHQAALNDTEKSISDAQARVDRAEQQREDLQSGWILGRQVMRVKAVRGTVSKPIRAQFLTESTQPGQPPHLQWPRYLGHLVLWYTNSFTAHRIDDFDQPPFDLRELVLTIERLAAVSTPWQSYFTKVRDVYRWEDPQRTAQIMLTFWTLWYFQHIATFAIGFIIYITLRNKFYPTSVQAVRERVQRSRDQSTKVRAWGELIQKHGEHDWLEPLIDDIGPLMQMQLGDLTMFLERLQNFYRWARPKQTYITLSFFACCFLFSLLSSMKLFVRMISFGAGCYFFYSFPIAANYPKYRHVVSPVFWMFWGIPDFAELAIIQLQEKTVTRDHDRLAMLEHKKEPAQFLHEADLGYEPEYPLRKNASLESQTISSQTPQSQQATSLQGIQSSDSLTFKTILLPNHTPAYINLTRSHIIIKPDKQPAISHPYSLLLEIRKIDISTDSNQTSSSNDTNKLSRSTHLAAKIEKMTNVQLLPDGLSFIFLQENTLGSNHLAELQNQQVVDSTRNHDIEKAPVPASLPEVDPSYIPQNPSLPHQGPQPMHNVESYSNNQVQKTQFSLILNKTDRDKIFAIVLSWSGLRWQPLFSMNRQNRLGHRRKKDEGNTNLDDAVKKALS